MKVLITSKNGYATREMVTCEHCGNTGIVKHPRGSVVDFPDALAIKLMNNGIAVPAPKPDPRTATRAPQENAAKRTGKAAKKTAPAVKEDVDA